MSYIVSVFNGSSYYCHNYYDKNEVLEKASKFLTGDYSGQSRIVVDVATTMVIYQNIKDSHIEISSGLRTQTSGVMKENLIRRLKDNALIKIKQNKQKSPIKKEVTKEPNVVQTKQVKPQNSTVNTVSVANTELKNESDAVQPGFKSFTVEEIKQFYYAAPKVIAEVKKELETQVLKCYHIYCRHGKRYLYLLHMGIPQQGAKLNKYTVIIQQKEKQFLLVEILDGHLSLVETN